MGYGTGGLKTSSQSDGCFRGRRRQKHGLPLTPSAEPAETCQTCHPCARQTLQDTLRQRDFVGEVKFTQLSLVFLQMKIVRCYIALYCSVAAQAAERETVPLDWILPLGFYPRFIKKSSIDRNYTGVVRRSYSLAHSTI